jgi:hypothetical protein
VSDISHKHKVHSHTHLLLILIDMNSVFRKEFSNFYFYFGFAYKLFCYVTTLSFLTPPIYYSLAERAVLWWIQCSLNESRYLCFVKCLQPWTYTAHNIACLMLTHIWSQILLLAVFLSCCMINRNQIARRVRISNKERRLWKSLGIWHVIKRRVTWIRQSALCHCLAN